VKRYRIIASLAIAASLALLGADWPQFRGQANQGVALDAKLPTTWTVAKDGAKSENVAWVANLPGRGVSSPIAVAGKVIVTASSGAKQDRLHVVCFDAASGKLAWERQFWATGRTLCHPTSAVAANTPASDGKLIFAFYSSNDLVCLDLDGNLKWFRGLTHDFPTAANDVGMSSSPLVAGNTVIVQVENKGESFAAGIDTAIGETRWQINRTAEMNWTSPALLAGKTPAEDVVLLQSTTGLTAHEPASGKQLWAYEKTCAGIPSPVGLAGLVLVPSSGLTALRHQATASTAEVLWNSNKLDPGNASPIVHDGKIYVLNRAGAMTCADAATGDIIWRQRLKGTFWATPVLVGDRIYVVNQDGLAQVVQLGDKPAILGESDFDEQVFGSPAVAGNALYVRSDAHLWKVAQE
jgi:outer membrane protein assembly factor BamB